MSILSNLQDKIHHNPSSKRSWRYLRIRALEVWKNIIISPIWSFSVLSMIFTLQSPFSSQVHFISNNKDNKSIVVYQLVFFSIAWTFRFDKVYPSPPQTNSNNSVPTLRGALILLFSPLSLYRWELRIIFTQETSSPPSWLLPGPFVFPASCYSEF